METSKLTPSEKRIKNADSARALYKKFRSDSEQRRAMLARVIGQLNGGRPFDEAKLVKDGQSWRCNINFRDASSMLEQETPGRTIESASERASITSANSSRSRGEGSPRKTVRSHSAA